MNKQERAAQIAAQREAEQTMGRLYNVRNAASEYAKDLAKQGIKVETVFYDYDHKRLPPERWGVKVGDELLTMEEFQSMMILMGYIK